MSAGWVAVWAPDGEITREEMNDFGRGIIEAAHAEGADMVVIHIPPDRQVTMTRHQFLLPVFIESPDWREARDFADALEQRAQGVEPVN